MAVASCSIDASRFTGGGASLPDASGGDGKDAATDDGGFEAGDDGADLDARAEGSADVGADRSVPEGSMPEGSMLEGSMPEGSRAEGSVSDGARDSGTVFDDHCSSYPQKLPFKVDSVFKAFLGCQNPTCSSAVSPYFAPVRTPDCDQAIPSTGLDPPPFGPDAGPPSTQGSGEGGVDGGSSCFEFLYNPNCSTPPCWAGVIFAQSPFAAVDPGVCVEPGAREIVFSARASRPNARLKAGMVGALATTGAVTESYVDVSTEWQVYVIPMPAGLDYDKFTNNQNGVWNFFSVILEPEFHPGGTYVFLRDITWSN
jgi:hypothetical protein